MMGAGRLGWGTQAAYALSYVLGKKEAGRVLLTISIRAQQITILKMSPGRKARLAARSVPKLAPAVTI